MKTPEEIARRLTYMMSELGPHTPYAAWEAQITEAIQAERDRAAKLEKEIEELNSDIDELHTELGNYR